MQQLAQYSNPYLRVYFLSYISKGASGIDVLPVDNLGDVQENEWFSMDESVKDVLFQRLMVIFYILSLANFEGVVAVREDDRGQLVLIIHNVTAMEVCDGNLVFSPEREDAKRQQRECAKLLLYPLSSAPY